MKISNLPKGKFSRSANGLKKLGILIATIVITLFNVAYANAQDIKNDCLGNIGTKDYVQAYLEKQSKENQIDIAQLISNNDSLNFYVAADRANTCFKNNDYFEGWKILGEYANSTSVDKAASMVTGNNLVTLPSGIFELGIQLLKNKVNSMAINNIMENYALAMKWCEQTGKTVDQCHQRIVDCSEMSVKNTVQNPTVCFDSDSLMFNGGWLIYPKATEQNFINPDVNQKYFYESAKASYEQKKNTDKISAQNDIAINSIIDSYSKKGSAETNKITATPSGDFFSGLLQKVTGTLQAVYNGIKSVITNTVNYAQTAVPQLFKGTNALKNPQPGLVSEGLGRIASKTANEQQQKPYSVAVQTPTKSSATTSSTQINTAQPTFSIIPTNKEVPATAGSTTFDLAISDKAFEYSVKLIEGWPWITQAELTVNKNTGKTEGPLKITYTANNGPLIRTGKVAVEIFGVSGSSKIITLTQAAALSVSQTTEPQTQEVTQLPTIEIAVNGNTTSNNSYDIYSDVPVTFSWSVSNPQTVVGIRIGCSALFYDGGSAKFMDGSRAGSPVECDNGRGASQIYQASSSGQQTIIFHNPTPLPRGVSFSVFVFSSNEEFETAKVNNPSISALAIGAADLTFKRTAEETKRLAENPVVVKVNGIRNFLKIPSQPNMALKMEWDIDPEFLSTNKCYYFIREPYLERYGYPSDNGIQTFHDSFNLTFDESPVTSRSLLGVYCFNKEENINNIKAWEDKLNVPNSISEAENSLKKLGKKADWVEILIVRKVQTPEWLSKFKMEFVPNQETTEAGSRVKYSFKVTNISNTIVEIPKNTGLSFSYFLSKNSILNLDDVELGTSFLGLSDEPMVFEVGEYYNLNVDPLMIPSNTPSGNYFIGVLFEDGSQTVASIKIE